MVTCHNRCMANTIWAGVVKRVSVGEKCLSVLQCSMHSRLLQAIGKHKDKHCMLSSLVH